MDVRQALISQYLAALEMLKQSIEACPAELWFDPKDTNKFSQVAYHALYWTHAYLQENNAAFQPDPRHRDDYRLAGGDQPEPHQIASKELVLDYLAFCQQESARKIATLDLDAASGFEWLALNKYEHLLYNLRHIMYHVGELDFRLGASVGIEMDWVDSGELAPKA